jgi:non-specific serine/threonine protein kinase/serine/threonine-protein kinase
VDRVESRLVVSGPDPAERWRRISALFDEVIEQPPELRGAYLEAACAGDPDLLARVLELVDAAERASGLLERPAFTGAAELLRELADPPTVEIGPVRARSRTAPESPIGPYELLEKLGEGGMGEVWRAEQQAPIRRAVALKIIKAGMDTHRVVARFEAERQALARMDHPAIARVFDAGETPRGLPYFAMEHVAGEPIHRYCERRKRGIRERLALFVAVCDGVQHAHQKGIIHRDLKPSNVLVTEVDGKAMPKIIDFGVAKAMAEPLTERTLQTELGTLIGTPEYMSPEQTGLPGLDVDTRSDVYSLGVMLYELLTGALPFESKKLRARSLDEIRRTIVEVEPVRPSVAGKNRRLAGDLDWIVMKALEKERQRRYGSPGELAADLRRHLADEPVVASPPGTLYRVRKFARRHTIAVSLSTAAAAGLVVFAGSIGLQARRLARERDHAERVSTLLVDIFKGTNVTEGHGETLKAIEILAQGEQKVRGQLEREPEVQAALFDMMGRVYLGLGLVREARNELSSAVALRERILGPLHADTRASRSHLAAAEAVEREDR